MKKVEHDNIVRFLDVFQTCNNMYIISELCESGDLKTLLKRRKKLPEKEALGYLLDLMNGFQHLDSHEIIHRDLKPANILLQNGKCKITDFGFARNL